MMALSRLMTEMKDAEMKEEKMFADADTDSDDCLTEPDVAALLRREYRIADPPLVREIFTRHGKDGDEGRVLGMKEFRDVMEIYRHTLENTGDDGGGGREEGGTGETNFPPLK